MCKCTDINTENVIKIINCKDCIYYKPPHILMNDRTERAYTEEEIKKYGVLGVPSSVGINVGGMCVVDENRGYRVDKSVFRSENDYCSKAAPKGRF